MTKYRITYNKFADYYRYKVEKKVPIIKGFWKRKIVGYEWEGVVVDGCGFYSPHAMFGTLRQAKSFIRKIVRRGLSEKYGWRPMTNKNK